MCIRDRRGREVPVSLQQWLAQRVAHIHRAGPGNQPGIVLALLYRLDAARVRELTLGGRARLAAGTGRMEETWLREHPGTLANLEDFRLDLEAMARLHRYCGGEAPLTLAKFWSLNFPI